MKKRICKICKKEKILEVDFYITKTTDNKIYYRHDCKKCKQTSESNRKRKLFNFINNYKKKHKCIKCGFSDHRALQFHHNSHDKLMDVSTMCSNGYSISKILEEIEKCEVLCANCHSIKHSNY